MIDAYPCMARLRCGARGRSVPGVRACGHAASERAQRLRPASSVPSCQIGTDYRDDVGGVRCGERAQALRRRESDHRRQRAYEARPALLETAHPRKIAASVGGFGRGDLEFATGELGEPSIPRLCAAYRTQCARQRLATADSWSAWALQRSISRFSFWRSTGVRSPTLSLRQSSCSAKRQYDSANNRSESSTNPNALCHALLSSLPTLYRLFNVLWPLSYSCSRVADTRAVATPIRCHSGVTNSSSNRTDSPFISATRAAPTTDSCSTSGWAINARRDAGRGLPRAPEKNPITLSLADSTILVSSQSQ